MRADTDFSTIFTEMDNAGVPADFKWRALFIYGVTGKKRTTMVEFFTLLSKLDFLGVNRIW